MRRASAAAIGISPSTLATGYHNDACGACDVCLKELEPSPEPIVLARKILSCVARVGQRFGSTHVASVLRGQTSEQVLARGHDRLTTFGLLPDASVAEVRGYIEQLLGAGLLRQTDDVPGRGAHPQRIGALERSGKQPRTGARPPAAATKGRTTHAVSRRGGIVERRRSQPLRTAACAVRLKLRARAASLRMSSSMTRRCARWHAPQPTSMDALLTVKGVGARKADDLGAALEAIRGHS